MRIGRGDDPKEVIMKTLILALVVILGTTVVASAQKSVTLRHGQQKTAGSTHLIIKFVSVVEDSRCPTDANCVWAGNAKIKILVKDPKGRSREFELNSNLADKTALFGGYEIGMTKLVPHPTMEDSVKRPYTVTLNIKKTGK